MKIENQKIRCVFDSQGAQCLSIFDIQAQKEYLYQGDHISWKGRAPLLFPFVGRLWKDQYQYQGKTYPMSRHGFARDRAWTLLELGKDFLSFGLDHRGDETYPFPCRVKVTYALADRSLSMMMEVENLSDQVMLYSAGFHPGFYLDWSKKSRIFLQGNQKLTCYQLEGPYLIGQEPCDNLMISHQDLDLSKTLVLKGVDHVELYQEDWGLAFDWKNMAYCALWQPQQAPFLCVEGWAGLPDWKDGQEDLSLKEGIQSLQGHQKMSHFMQVHLL